MAENVPTTENILTSEPIQTTQTTPSTQNIKISQNFSDLSRTNDVATTKTFRDLAISEKILAGLDESGFDSATPIQVRSIPYLRQNHSLIIHGKSGTGKTVIFAIAALEKCLKINDPECGLISVVICPTREIAIQGFFSVMAIAQNVKVLDKEGREHGVKVNLSIGGYSEDDTEWF